MSESLNPAQLLAARAMLDWSLIDMAKAAGLSVSTVCKAEQGKTDHVPHAAWNALAQVLRTAGITFDADADMIRVGLRTPQPSPQLRLT